MRLVQSFLVVFLLVVTGANPIAAESTPAAAAAEAEAVKRLIDVELALLESDRERYERLITRRSDVRARIEQLQRALDGAVREEEAPDAFLLTRIADQLQAAEADCLAVQDSERAVVERVSERLQRLGLFQGQLEALLSRPTAQPSGLDGQWEISLMPIDQRGTCTFRQSGAVVTGTYEFEGGWTGSLQGTLVNRKVFLVRIDSKLGKSMELEGYVSGDGTRIRGSWLNYELAGRDGSTGNWSAFRQADRP